MKALINQEKVAYFATSDFKGNVNVSPKDIYVIDDNTVAYSDLGSEKTRANLKENPQIAICVANLKSHWGYQLKGIAEVLEEGEIHERVLNILKSLPFEIKPPKYVIKVAIQETYNLIKKKKGAK